LKLYKDSSRRLSKGKIILGGKKMRPRSRLQERGKARPKRIEVGGGKSKKLHPKVPGTLNRLQGGEKLHQKNVIVGEKRGLLEKKGDLCADSCAEPSCWKKTEND